MSWDKSYFFITFLVLSNIDFIEMSPYFCLSSLFTIFFHKMSPWSVLISLIQFCFSFLSNIDFATFECLSNCFESLWWYLLFLSFYRDIFSFFLTIAQNKHLLKTPLTPWFYYVITNTPHWANYNPPDIKSGLILSIIVFSKLFTFHYGSTKI